MDIFNLFVVAIDFFYDHPWLWYMWLIICICISFWYGNRAIKKMIAEDEKRLQDYKTKKVKER